MTTATANSKITDEAQIRALIDDRAKAVCDKNVRGDIEDISFTQAAIGISFSRRASSVLN